MMCSPTGKLIALSLLYLGAADAAEIRYKDGDSTIAIVGVIERGDATKLAETLSIANVDDSVVLHVALASSGGDILEAMRMGKMLREHFIPTTHHSMAMNGRCAASLGGESEPDSLGADSCGCHSSCFVIWAGGPYRTSGTPLLEGGPDGIGIHRPKFDAGYFSDLSASEAEKEYGRITDLVMQYLREMGIPDELSEKMFSVSSEDIYMLSESEIKVLESPPAITEWLISKCGAIGEDDESDRMSYGLREYVGDDPLSEMEQRHNGLLQRQYSTYLKCKGAALRSEQQSRL